MGNVSARVGSMSPTGSIRTPEVRSTRHAVMSRAEYNSQFLREPSQADRDRVRALLQQRAS